ncbi:glycosyltransferase family 2 protein [Halomonas sp. IOP_31]|uniref:glycosyltransferase family 2 protein n=1 Tax=Halomonas sp. IOP_31 TaxID=2876584 RepID=UPI001E370FBB|nr:glycosyltransferase family A protein [Halomonas sp. IOP_31]MCD6007031.1 glycosyltransferase family 2 protein [Halomonas sp. IOP_31]|tara:strand:+ start:338 stop:1237 length:900 start_codon:yes stop_codon:yes gene_type:complete
MDNLRLPVSVVITTYNDAEYLEQALNSVIKQTILPTEVIIVDDGSETNKAERIVGEKFWGTPLDLTYYRKNNGGPSSARNYGLKCSRQKYLAFLDVDDRMLPENLESKFKLIDSLPNNYFSVYGSYIISRNNKEANYRDYDGAPPTSLIGRRDGIPGCVYSYLFRRDLLDEVGGFDEELTHNEDFDLLIRLIKKGHYCRGSTGPGLYRNYRPGSLTRNTKYYEVYNAVSLFLSKAQDNDYFSEEELNKRRKSNSLSLARKLFLGGKPKGHVKSALLEAFSYSKPSSYKEYLAYLFCKII